MDPGVCGRIKLAIPVFALQGLGIGSHYFSSDQADNPFVSLQIQADDPLPPCMTILKYPLVSLQGQANDPCASI
jgi:hypothetical protein